MCKASPWTKTFFQVLKNGGNSLQNLEALLPQNDPLVRQNSASFPVENVSFN